MKTQLRILFLTVSLGASAMAVGCDPPREGAVVQGTVTIEGELANAGTVSFHPKDGDFTAYGSIRSDGSYSLKIGQGTAKNIDYSRIPPGEYIATVYVKGPSAPDESEGPGAPPKPGLKLSAKKYSSKETSGLSFVLKKGLNVVNLELERASVEEVEETDESVETAVEEEAPEEEQTQEETELESSEVGISEEAINSEDKEPVEELAK